MSTILNYFQLGLGLEEIFHGILRQRNGKAVLITFYFQIFEVAKMISYA